ncbi:hypothetical protein AAG570_009394 [Ranatra chinensis]|uniref:Uncharacterized protein n=1 Tax=Ranatra chinensis TaxID=642074 RepID=A0ABD0Z625_9HEMI
MRGNGMMIVRCSPATESSHDFNGPDAAMRHCFLQARSSLSATSTFPQNNATLLKFNPRRVGTHNHLFHVQLLKAENGVQPPKLEQETGHDGNRSCRDVETIVDIEAGDVLQSIKENTDVFELEELDFVRIQLFSRNSMSILELFRFQLVRCLGANVSSDCEGRWIPDDGASGLG